MASVNSKLFSQSDDYDPTDSRYLSADIVALPSNRPYYELASFRELESKHQLFTPPPAPRLRY